MLVLFASLLFLALAGTAGATCISCNSPCEGPNGPSFECNDDGLGPYGSCTNLTPCRGCRGFFDFDCLNFSAELMPAPQAPLLGVRHVTAVVVRTDAKPADRPAYRVALAR
jgi:hypothetical protein